MIPTLRASELLTFGLIPFIRHRPIEAAHFVGDLSICFYTKMAVSMLLRK